MILLHSKFLMTTGFFFFVSLSCMAFLTFFQMSEIINDRLII